MTKPAETCPRCLNILPHRRETEGLCNLGLIGPSAEKRRAEKARFHLAIEAVLSEVGYYPDDATIHFGRGPGSVGFWSVRIQASPPKTIRITLPKEMWPFSTEALDELKQAIRTTQRQCLRCKKTYPLNAKWIEVKRSTVTFVGRVRTESPTTLEGYHCEVCDSHYASMAGEAEAHYEAFKRGGPSLVESGWVDASEADDLRSEELRIKDAMMEAMSKAHVSAEKGYQERIDEEREAYTLGREDK